MTTAWFFATIYFTVSSIRFIIHNLLSLPHSVIVVHAAYNMSDLLPKSFQSLFPVFICLWLAFQQIQGIKLFTTYLFILHIAWITFEPLQESVGNVFGIFVEQGVTQSTRAWVVALLDILLEIQDHNNDKFPRIRYVHVSNSVSNGK